jgi:uncharacterized protein YfbU (UPF0304 family)
MARRSNRQMEREKWVKDEVRGILAMFRALRRAYEVLSDKSGIDESLVTFDGFDGNNEDEHLRAAREVSIATREPEIPNSHMPRLRGYQMMMEAWRSSHDKENLTKADILRIIRV